MYTVVCIGTMWVHTVCYVETACTCSVAVYKPRLLQKASYNFHYEQQLAGGYI